MRSKSHRLIFTLTLATCAALGIAEADTIVGSGSMQNWSTSVLANPTGTPFWNNTSWDGSQMNVGNCLSGVGNCHLSVTPGNMAYYGTSTGGAVPNFYMQSTGTAVSTELTGITADRNQESYGWYDVSNPTVLHSLYSPNGITTTSYMPTGNYGLYFQDGGKTYYSQSSITGSADSGNQHFAIFKQGSTYYIGMEDVARNAGDNDYNDLIVEVSTTTSAAPEPASIGMLTGALFVGAWLLKHRNKTRFVSAE